MIEVIRPGFYTTVQDMGRFNYHQYGVPYSGVMDIKSARIANALLSNNENAAVLEMTMTGPTLKFHSTTVISITGANLSPKLNGISIALNKGLQIQIGDVLSFGKLNYGFRGYLAVAGGFQTETIMNSRSMYKNITSKFVVKKGDTLPIKAFNKQISKTNAALKIETTHFEDIVLTAYKGPEFDNLSRTKQKQISSEVFTISKDNNRMAYQLSNIVENKLKPIITSLVQPGTVQLTPLGKLIILMRDGQTAGGYPRVLQLNDASINKLSQKYTNHEIRFKIKI